MLGPPSYERPRPSVLNRDQAQQLIDAARAERLEAAYVVGLTVGLRRGELLGLRWEDLDFEEHTLSVRQALERIGGSLQFVPQKQDEPPHNHTDRRLGPHLAQTRRSANRRTIVRRSKVVRAWAVFTTRIGTPIEPRNLTRDFKRVLRKADLPNSLRWHDLRHSTASLLLAQKVHPRVVMEQLGHSQISLTTDTYSHVVAPLMREAAAKMDAVLAAER